MRSAGERDLAERNAERELEEGGGVEGELAAKLRKARSISPRRLARSWVMTSRLASGLAASSRLHQRAQAASSDWVSGAE